MRIHTILRAGIALVAFAIASTASAQATRTWVSGVGDDANPCSRTAPCKTFAGAISKTATGGEISVLDPGGFGALTITKSMTIDGNGVVASILASGTHGVIVNGANVNVVLRNLQINGAGTGFDGIRFLQGKSLVIDDVTIQGFNGANGSGINFQPSNTNAVLTVRDTVLTGNGQSNGFGILVRPGAAGSANVQLDGVTATQNRVGLKVESRTTAAVRNSAFDGNLTAGIHAESVAVGSVLLNLDFVSAVNNDTDGLRSDGSANAVVLMSNTTVFGNVTGLNRGTVPNQGQIISFQNNRVGGNDTDGLPSATVTQD